MPELKDIPGFEGRYKINIEGEVFSLKQKIYLKQIKNGAGYLSVALWKNKKKQNKRIHRLIAEAFIDNPLTKPQVNHIDGDKLNNSIKNLEWVTVSENAKHAFDIGLRSNKGEKNSQSKLKECDVIEIRKLYSQGVSQKELASRFKIGQSRISDAVNRKTWKRLL